MKQIEHIGIAVKDIQASEKIFSALFGQKPYKHETVGSEMVTTCFYQAGPNKIELLEATDENSSIARYLSKNKEGIHHIAFEVDDIFKEMERLKAEGFQLLQDAPKKGADNKLVCFIHPKSANGILIELCQEIPEP
ncbi:MAG TPA: methylmalonyl-CoA epimerase [Saprospiraceae bacterium]|nr:methylmalonyl-CoA epimerase [Saprospiraceae bacterium]